MPLPRSLVLAVTVARALVFVAMAVALGGIVALAITEPAEEPVMSLPRLCYDCEGPGALSTTPDPAPTSR